MKNLNLTITIILTLTINFVFSQSGALDPTFGNNGIVITDYNNEWDELSSLEIQPDQKIIAIGWKYGVGQFLVCRYNTDGTLDTSFADNGLFIVFPPEIVVCQASALQADGKIIMGGTRPIFIVQTKSDEEDLILMRLQPEGKIDSTFGVNGIVITDLGGYFERIEEVLIQSDDKILVAGEAADNIQGGFYYMVRYNPNGLLDSTFGDFGIKKMYEEFEVTTTVLQPDGKILIGGYYFDPKPISDFEVHRFESDGSIDESFGNDGRVFTDLSGQRDIILGIGVEPDGRIFASGGANVTAGTADLAFARYYPNGSLDESYGDIGYEIISLPPYSVAHDLARQPDGKYVLCGGSYHVDTIPNFLLLRINRDGGLDETFGDHGLVFTDLQKSNQVWVDLVIQDNNYIVVGGKSLANSGQDFTLARYIVDDVVSTKYDHVETASLVASPNPCKDFIAIDTGKASDEFHCIISDITGNLKMDQTIRTDAEGKVKIDTRNFMLGHYSALLENKIMRGIASFVVQK